MFIIKHGPNSAGLAASGQMLDRRKRRDEGGYGHCDSHIQPERQATDMAATQAGIPVSNPLH